MGVDVADLLRLDASIAEGRAHDAVSAIAIFGGLGDVIGVGGHAVAHDFSNDGGVAALGVLERFEDEDAGAFTDDEAVALGVKGAAGALGLVIARGEGFHGRETADAHGGDGGFAAAADHDLGVAALDEAEGITHGMRGSRTRGGGGGIGSASAVANGDDAGSEINDGGGNEKRRDAAGAAFEKLAMLALDDVESADSGSDVDAGGVGDIGGDFEMGHAHGEIGGRPRPVE